MNTTLPKLKAYRTRYGGFGLIPADSTIVGDAVEIGAARTEEYANAIVRAVNSHQALIQAAKDGLVAMRALGWEQSQYGQIGANNRHAYDMAVAAIAAATSDADPGL